MKYFYLASVAGLGLIAVHAWAVEPEFSKECALGLANKQHIPTDCSVSWTAKSGSVYCFSNADAKSEFLKDTDNHLERAQVFWSSERIGQ